MEKGCFRLGFFILRPVLDKMIFTLIHFGSQVQKGGIEA